MLSMEIYLKVSCNLS